MQTPQGRRRHLLQCRKRALVIYHCCVAVVQVLCGPVNERSRPCTCHITMQVHVTSPYTCMSHQCTRASHKVFNARHIFSFCHRAPPHYSHTHTDIEVPWIIPTLTLSCSATLWRTNQTPKKASEACVFLKASKSSFQITLECMSMIFSVGALTWVSRPWKRRDQHNFGAEVL